MIALLKGVIMRKKLMIILAVFTLTAVCLPYKTIAKALSHKNFIAFILSNAAISNADILQQRHKLLNLYHDFINKKPLSAEQRQWLAGLAQQYRLKTFNTKNNVSWKSLIIRVDIVPNSQVVAQAINESAWGTSRFARQGNNYFGMWCYSKGCGIVPKQRAAGRQFEVRKFASVLSSVQAYMLNLNSNGLYKEYREQRHLLRLAGEPIYGLNLVSALTMYSTKRQTYVNLITNVIKHYDLAKYDTIGNTATPQKHSDIFNWF